MRKLTDGQEKVVVVAIPPARGDRKSGCTISRDQGSGGVRGLSDLHQDWLLRLMALSPEEGLRTQIPPDSEVHFVTSIAGGAGSRLGECYV